MTAGSLRCRRLSRRCWPRPSRGRHVPGRDSVPGGLSHLSRNGTGSAVIFRLTRPGRAAVAAVGGRPTYLLPRDGHGAEHPTPGTVIDGELIIVTDRHLNFDALSSRLRPRKEAGEATSPLARRTVPRPDSVAFDVLATAGGPCSPPPFAERRRVLRRWRPGP